MNTKRITKKAAKKLVANMNRQTARDNQAFEAMTPSEKRVTIARDVLAQIRLKRLIPTTGIWLDRRNGGGIFTKGQVQRNPELKEVLKGIKQCEGCALGGMFMCAVERANALKVAELEGGRDYLEEVRTDKYYGGSGRDLSLDTDAISENDAFTYLGKFFSEDQLGLIESCFEQNGGASRSSEADNFLLGEEDPAERMRLIMENIVVNKGKFCPEKAPKIVYVTPGFVE